VLLCQLPDQQCAKKVGRHRPVCGTTGYGWCCGSYLRTSGEAAGAAVRICSWGNYVGSAVRRSVPCCTSLQIYTPEEDSYRRDTSDVQLRSDHYGVRE
jgi:hypothetical protein